MFERNIVRLASRPYAAAFVLRLTVSRSTRDKLNTDLDGLSETECLLGALVNAAHLDRLTAQFNKAPHHEH